MNWKENTVLGQEEAEYWNIQDIAPAEARRTLITGIEVLVETTTTLPFAAKETLDNLRWYFTRSSLGMMKGSDAADVAYWAAYFAEMLILRMKQQRILVLRIEAQDEAGNPVAWDGGRLKH